MKSVLKAFAFAKTDCSEKILVSCKLTCNIVAHLWVYNSDLLCIFYRQGINAIARESPNQISHRSFARYVFKALEKFIYMPETYAQNILDFSVLIKNLTSVICSAYQKRGFPRGIPLMK